MARRPIACVFAVAFGLAGCVFPSFEGMGGGTGGSGDPEARTNRSGTDPDPGPDAYAPIPVADAATDGADAPTTTPDAGTSAPAKNFACANLRCTLGTQVCCGHTIGTDCRSTTAATNDCDGVTHCGDTRDCTGPGEQCCYNMNTKLGTCRTSCTTTSDIVVCELGNPTCPGSKKCNGRYFGLPYCI